MTHVRQEFIFGATGFFRLLFGGNQLALRRAARTDVMNNGIKQVATVDLNRTGENFNITHRSIGKTMLEGKILTALV